MCLQLAFAKHKKCNFGFELKTRFFSVVIKPSLFVSIHTQSYPNKLYHVTHTHIYYLSFFPVVYIFLTYVSLPWLELLFFFGGFCLFWWLFTFSVAFVFCFVFFCWKALQYNDCYAWSCLWPLRVNYHSFFLFTTPVDCFFHNLLLLLFIIIIIIVFFYFDGLLFYLSRGVAVSTSPRL